VDTYGTTIIQNATSLDLLTGKPGGVSRHGHVRAALDGESRPWKLEAVSTKISAQAAWRAALDGESRPWKLGGDMYGAFEISAHLFLSSLSFGECKHKVLVAIVFFMAIGHVMAVVAILQQLALHQHYGAMTMIFVVTPKLNSIEHKLNSKSIKFPKLHKVPTLKAININKP
jgi:hypothetical protein